MAYRQAHILFLITAYHCSVLPLTGFALSFLASSGDAVYKVMSTQDKCMYANLTCDPEVGFSFYCLPLCHIDVIAVLHTSIILYVIGLETLN